jgi:hypothetical protein
MWKNWKFGLYAGTNPAEPGPRLWTIDEGKKGAGRITIRFL